MCSGLALRTMKYGKSVIYFLLLLPVTASLCAQDDTLQHIVAGRTNSGTQQEKPYVILISVDGLRSDFVDKAEAVNLQRLRSQGVQAEYMQPSFPSLTFPNHYTLVTGLYPAHHGLVDNNFFDPAKGKYSMSNKPQVADGSWYGGTPLWVLAEKQRMLSASFYWVASESAIQGVRPTYYYVYNEKIGINQRIARVKEWLELPEDKRPHMITMYFPQVDHDAHAHGPDSPEAAAAVRYVDEAIGKLVAALEPLNLPVNFIVVSDHGMAQVSNERQISLPAVIDTAHGFRFTGEAILHLYAKDSAVVLPTYQSLLKDAGKDYSVYLNNNLPQRWHYGGADDRYHRIGDIILESRPPAFFHTSTRKNTSIGKHGFDPALKEMRASFYAWGPAFKKRMVIPGFENVHVYPLVASILGLSYDEKTIDGDIKVLQNILK
jgi:predicted AlkP superfamily pyrophosphatase or phosphodiesterase